jgi:hypothetical protein
MAPRQNTGIDAAAGYIQDVMGGRKTTIQGWLKQASRRVGQLHEFTANNMTVKITAHVGSDASSAQGEVYEIDFS